MGKTMTKATMVIMMVGFASAIYQEKVREAFIIWCCLCIFIKIDDDY